MIKTFISTLAVTGMLTISHAAQADQSWNGPYGGHWHNSQTHAYAEPKGEKQKTLKKNLFRSVRREDIHLRRMFGLKNKGEYAGYEVNTIIVKLKGHNNRGRIRLMVNGRVTDAENIRGEQVIRLRAPNQTRIGQNLKSLRLDVDGKAFIKDIKIRMSRPVEAERNKPRRHHTQSHDIDRRTMEHLARLILRQWEYRRF